MIREFLYRLNYKYARQLKPKHPIDVTLELSSFCNLRCQYCYHANQMELPFSKCHMSMTTARSILRESAEMGVNSLKFNWRGESHLNKNFSKITKMAKDLAHGSTFIDRISNSNFFFKPDRFDIFEGFLNQTKVKISLDSLRQDVLDQQRKGAIAGAIANNIDEFHNWPERKTKIVIQAVRTNLNKDEDLETIFKRRWPDAEVSIRDMVEGRNDDSTGLNCKTRNFIERQPCRQAFSRLIFDARGNATACCPDIEGKINLGNIREGLYHIWNGPRRKALMEALKNGSAFEYEPCGQCSSFESFKGYQHKWES